MSASVEQTRPRIALAHDWLVGLRGGEWVLDAIIHALAPRVELTALFVMFHGCAPLTPAIDALPTHVSRVGRLPGANVFRRWLLPLYPAAVHDLSRRLAHEHRRHPIDLLISTSSAAIKNLKPPPGVPHLCYCHSPARYLWSRQDAYAGHPLREIGLRVFAPRLREWDRATSASVTRFIANSTYTAREIARCYGLPADVVHPPVRVNFFTPPAPGAQRGDHFLVVSALEPYKRVDLAIRAAALAGRELRIVGDGSERQRLERLARRLESLSGQDARGAPPISSRRFAVRFLGRLRDEDLRHEYRSARLLLFPQVEDFGIVAAEAQACGLPVVARAAGGALDIVRNAITGALFQADTPESLLAAVARCPGDADHACRINALRFAPQKFEYRLTTIVHEMLAQDRITRITASCRKLSRE
jgi:glycosyltransferase involved in cell wall biosynthesis